MIFASRECMEKLSSIIEKFGETLRKNLACCAFNPFFRLISGTRKPNFRISQFICNLDKYVYCISRGQKYKKKGQHGWTAQNNIHTIIFVYAKKSEARIKLQTHFRTFYTAFLKVFAYFLSFYLEYFGYFKIEF